MSLVQYQGDPHAYRKVRQGKNCMCFCTEVEHRPDGVYRCGFKKREDHLKSQIREGKIHICNLEKVEYSKTLESYFVPEAPSNTVITFDDILTKVAILVGRKNLSLETGSSEEMQELVRTAICYGMLNSKSTIDEIFRPIKVDTVRKCVISAARDVHKIQYSLFSNLQYVGVSIDEGSTRGIKDLDFVLENPLSDLKPYPCFTSVMTSGNATSYTEHLARGLDFLRINKIKVGSVTVDGNKAQLKALSFTWKKSLRNRYIDHDEFLKHILVNPCLCHRINCAYKAAYNKCDELKEAVDMLREIAVECKDHPADVLDVCPSVQLTRWVVDYDLCTFILNHKQRIKKFRDFDEPTLLMLRDVLSVLKSLTNIFENTKTPHFKAFRLLEKASGALDELKILKGNLFAQCIEEELRRYTLNPADCGIWLLSYLLTPAGRKDFSLRINKKTFPPKSDYNSLFSCGKQKEKEEIESIVDACIENVDFPQKPEDYSNDLEGILAPLEDDEEEEESDDDFEYTPAFDSTTEESEDSSDDDEKSNGMDIDMERMPFYPAQVYLKQVLINWGIAPVSRQRVIDAFNSFISDKNDIFKDQKLENGDYFWQHIRQINPIWDTLGEIACRLHCSPCSEASCERTISMQRLVLTARRMSSKKELLDARLTLLRGLNSS